MRGVFQRELLRTPASGQAAVRVVQKPQLPEGSDRWQRSSSAERTFYGGQCPSSTLKGPARFARRSRCLAVAFGKRAASWFEKNCSLRFLSRFSAAFSSTPRERARRLPPRDGVRPEEARRRGAWGVSGNFSRVPFSTPFQGKTNAFRALPSVGLAASSAKTGKGRAATPLAAAPFSSSKPPTRRSRRSAALPRGRGGTRARPAGCA